MNNQNPFFVGEHFSEKIVKYARTFDVSLPATSHTKGCLGEIARRLEV